MNTANELDILYTTKVSEALEKVLEDAGLDPQDTESGKRLYRFLDGWDDARVAEEVGTDVKRVARIRRLVKGELARGPKPTVKVVEDGVTKMSYGYQILMKHVDTSVGERLDRLEASVAEIKSLIEDLATKPNSSYPIPYTNTYTNGVTTAPRMVIDE